jgi:hypothetical protein
MSAPSVCATIFATEEDAFIPNKGRFHSGGAEALAEQQKLRPPIRRELATGSGEEPKGTAGSSASVGMTPG